MNNRVVHVESTYYKTQIRNFYTLQTFMSPLSHTVDDFFKRPLLERFKFS